MRRVAGLLMLAALAGGCDTLTGGAFAQAQLVNLNDSRAWGRVMLHETDGKTLVGSMFDRPAPIAQSMAADAGTVFIRFDVKNLPSNRQFTFSVHEIGDCSANGSRVGPLFVAGGNVVQSGAQAGPATKVPLIYSDGEGNAMTSFTTTEFTVTAGPRSIIGRAIVVREKSTDFLSAPGAQPGAVIACGVVRPTG